MTESTSPSLPPDNNRASKLTVSGLVLGGLGLCCGLLTGFPAAICGIISLFRLKKYPATKNLVMIIITLCLSFASIVTTGIWAGIAVIGQRAMQNAEQTRDVANAKQIGVLLTIYAKEHDGKFPANEDELKTACPGWWALSLTKEYVVLTGVDTNEKWHYFLNHTIGDPPDTVLLQSADGHVIFTVGGSTKYLKQPRHH
ncbi:MAG: hypothetical protein LBK60_01120 [Verrucomicrobiales bacterium]|jgi:hypothetical protein|nr:hypothetical protein [Verrucomicrobiales bacterium]